MSEELPLGERLENYFRRSDKDFQISDFTPISDGWETEVYSFTLVNNGRPTPRILRMYPGADAVEKSAREYQGMLTLRRVSGYPVPSVMRQESDPAWLGKPFVIMEKIEGRPLGKLLREDAAGCDALFSRFVQLLVDLHRVDAAPFLWSQPAEIQADPTRFLPLRLAYARRLILGELGQAWTLLLLATQGYEHLRPIILSQYERLSGHPVEQIEYFEVMAALRRLFDFAVSVGSGAETLGMRPETAAVMRQRRGHYQQVYDWLRERTGLRLPEIERLIEGLAQGSSSRLR